MRSAITPYALIFSVLIHLFLSWSVFSNILPSPSEAPQTPLVAELIEPMEMQIRPKEIAPPSQSPETKEAPKNARLSEKNAQVEKESIRKGDTEFMPSPRQEKSPPPPRVPASPPNPQKTERVVEKASAPGKQIRSQNSSERSSGDAMPGPKLKSSSPPLLKLDQNDLLARLGPGKVDPQATDDEISHSSERLSRSRKEDVRSDKEREMQFLSVQPFQKSSSGNFGRQGVSDMLLNVPDGEITVLNEKADQFAVFVRRVASQVFGILRRSSWGSLSAYEVDSLEDFAKVRAILSPKGKFIRLELVGRSGITRFDELLEDSVAKGANDQNPPREALAPDGNFRFVFMARTWSRRLPNGMPEQRWLVLGTGLE